MVRTGTEGFQVSFPALVEFFTFVGCECVDLPLQTVGSVCGNFFFLITQPTAQSNSEWSLALESEPNLGIIFQSQRKYFLPH